MTTKRPFPSMTEAAPSIVSCGERNGCPTLEIATRAAVYEYDLRGGGLSSLRDGGGRDWIGFGAGEGPAGAFRGVPNLVYRSPDRGFFHPGFAGARASETTWGRDEDGSVRLLSRADSGRREVE